MTKTFKQTSDLPYDRHNYKLVLSNGKEVIFEDYEDVQVTWFQTPYQFLSHIEILDKTESKGFANTR
jgi:co-chaperonin GroES (HSP10)